jgi:hypothetical protein
MRKHGLNILLVSALASTSAQAQTAVLWDLQQDRAVSLPTPAVRSSNIAVRHELINAQAQELRLRLLDGRLLDVRLQQAHSRAADRVSWLGQVLGEPDSHVLLTREGEHLAGYISSSAGTFEISPSAAGTVLLEHDSARFPECAGDTHPPASAADLQARRTQTTPTAALPAPNDEPDRIDALIVFSPSSVSNLGGQAQAQTYAQSAIDLANLTYVNSNMIARLRLAGVRFTSRADSGNSSTDLSWLRGNAEVAEWRNQTRADLVGMISEFSNSCGQGYLMTTNSSGFAANAFQVSARSCAIGNLTYPHEHGHNMGFAHNPEDSGSAVTPYAYGHWHSGQYRTVMSYSNPCVGGCTRRPYFSNPDISFNGLPTGVAEQRDNARAGDLTAPTIANFRDDLDAPDTVLRNGFE